MNEISINTRHTVGALVLFITYLQVQLMNQATAVRGHHACVFKAYRIRIEELDGVGRTGR